MSIKIKYLPEVSHDNKFYRSTYNMVGDEISSTSSPCYMPKLVRYYADMKANLNVDEQQIKDFKIKNFSKQYQKWNILSDKQTLLILIAIVYFARKRKPDIAKLFTDYLTVKFYASRVHIHFPKYCNPDAWALTLDRVSHKHLFKVKKGIPSTLQYISAAIYKKYGNNLNKDKLTDKDLVTFVYALRTRIAQSTRSFAELYYKVLQEPDPVQQKEDIEEKINMVANKISQQICTYGNVDKKALTYAILKSGLRKELSKTLISELAAKEFREELLFIIILMNKLYSIKNICKEAGRNALLRKILSKQKVDKYIVYDKIMDMVKGTESSYSLSSVQDDQVVSFFSQYLITYLKNRIC